MRKSHVLLAAATLVLLAGGLYSANLLKPSELSGIAGWKGAQPGPADSFRFVIFGDRAGGIVPGAWAQAIAETNRIRPDFVICVGDLVEGFIQTADEAAAEWKELDDLTQKLQPPFFYCAGNHDVNARASAQLYNRLHGINGRNYYSFDYRSCHFVVLDTCDLSGWYEPDSSAAHWEWLAKDLAAAKQAKHVFVFGHHPLYDTPAWTRLRKLLEPKKTTVFAGHLHELNYGLEDDVPYYLLPPTAARVVEGELHNGKFNGFTHVVVEDGKPTISFLPLGAVLPHDYVQRKKQ